MSEPEVIVTYLHMFDPPSGEPVDAPPGARVVHRPSLSVEDYRALYAAVGADWEWSLRLDMPAADLAGTLADPAVDVYVLQCDGADAGYAELDRRIPGQTQLAYFGLTGAFIGRGLGKFLLDWIVRRAWSENPERVWVHTCTLDHPRALATYERAGFEVYAALPAPGNHVGP